MKGMIFTRLIEMADTMLGPDRVKMVIAEACLPSGGAYTAVGNYPHSEAVTLLDAFSAASCMPVRDLLGRFGEHMLEYLHRRYTAFFEKCPDAFSFFESIDSYVHVEVRKLYFDAELPRLVAARDSPGRLRFDYHSSRHLEDFAAGLIRGTLRLFLENANVTQTDASGEYGPCIRFIIEKQHPPSHVL